MKKVLLALLFGLLVLTACGGNEENTENADPVEGVDSAEQNAEQDESKEKITLHTAQSGDSVESDWGTYIIKKVVETNSQHETGPIQFVLQKVILSTFEPYEENKFLFDDQDNMNLAIALIESENMSDDTVSFHPFSTKVTTDTKGQYGAQSGLNTGDSEHIGNVIQEFVTPFNLENEDLNAIKELTFVFDGAAKDARTIGDDVTIKVFVE